MNRVFLFLVALLVTPVTGVACAAPYVCDLVTVESGRGVSYKRAFSADIVITDAVATVTYAGMEYTLPRASVAMPGFPTAYVTGNSILARMTFFGLAPRIEVWIGDTVGPQQNPTPPSHYLCWP